MASPVAAPVPVAVLIARVGRAVRQRVELALGPFGLRQRQLVALSYLHEHGPTPQQTLAEHLCMDASSLVSLLNQLEESRLIARRRDRADRRRAILELTPRGQRTHARIADAIQAIDNDILGELEPTERETLRHLLSRLHAGQTDWGTAANESDP